MRLNPKFILVISITCGMIAFYLTLQTLRNAQKEKPITKAVTAITDLDMGTVVKAQDIQLFNAPSDTDPGTIFQDIEAVTGKTLRNPVKRGVVIKIFDVVKEGDNLASMIPAGYRALTIALPLSPETLQFLKFGSRVDVVFTADTRLLPNMVETKTIMKNILVLRVATAEGGAGKNLIPVTLAIKPVGAEILSYAKSKGKIDLNIRPLSDSNTQDEYMNLDELAGIKKTALKAEKKAPEVEVIRGVAKDKVVLA